MITLKNYTKPKKVAKTCQLREIVSKCHQTRLFGTTIWTAQLRSFQSASVRRLTKKKL